MSPLGLLVRLGVVLLLFCFCFWCFASFFGANHVIVVSALFLSTPTFSRLRGLVGQKIIIIDEKNIKQVCCSNQNKTKQKKAKQQKPKQF